MDYRSSMLLNSNLIGKCHAILSLSLSLLPPSTTLVIPNGAPLMGDGLSSHEVRYYNHTSPFQIPKWDGGEEPPRVREEGKVRNLQG